METSHVLIVEDDPAVRCLLAAIARRDWLSAIAVEDGEAALRELRLRRFDAVMLDLLLPRRNGFEILHHMRCLDPTMLQRTIVLTGASDATLRVCADLELVRCVLRKPVDIEHITAELRACTRSAGGARTRGSLVT
jgi:adenylate cyclase